MKSLLVLIAVVSFAATGFSQTPAQLVVPAANTPAAMPVRQAVAVEPSNASGVMHALEQLKAANEETIQKQTATLQMLDELLKNAEQLRIFTKRS